MSRKQSPATIAAITACENGNFDVDSICDELKRLHLKHNSASIKSVVRKYMKENSIPVPKKQDGIVIDPDFLKASFLDRSNQDIEKEFAGENTEFMGVRLPLRFEPIIKKHKKKFNAEVKKRLKEMPENKKAGFIMGFFSPQFER